MAETTPNPLLSICDLTISFPTDTGEAVAVNQLSLDIPEGEILGLVGESGCGKSLTSLAILRLIPEPGLISPLSTITFQGQNLLKLSDAEMRRIRGAQIALIPQDPLTSLNPVYTIGDQLCEVIQLHQGISKAEALKQAAELLQKVNVPNATERLNEYPHQFSGGMRQRVMIAMALSCSPKLLIADEPTTALDVTVQAQILTLMREIQQEANASILLITHDLGVVAELCDRVAVMYAGRLVEYGTVFELFQNPKHPYTRGLLNSLPRKGSGRLQPIQGQPPRLTEIPTGCAFFSRCPDRLPHCETTFPNQTAISPTQAVACHLYPE